jgi:hypothetical protein
MVVMGGIVRILKGANLAVGSSGTSIRWWGSILSLRWVPLLLRTSSLCEVRARTSDQR